MPPREEFQHDDIDATAEPEGAPEIELSADVPW